MKIEQGKRFKAIRKHLNQTKEDFATKLGVGRNTISMIESGRNYCTIHLLEKLLLVFNVNSTWFFKGTGNMFNNQNSQPVNTPNVADYMTAVHYDFDESEAFSKMVMAFGDEAADFFEVPFKMLPLSEACDMIHELKRYQDHIADGIANYHGFTNEQFTAILQDASFRVNKSFLSLTINYRGVDRPFIYALGRRQTT